MEVGSGSPIGALDVLKKSNDVQTQAVASLLDESAKQLSQQRAIADQTEQNSGSELTGLGVGLDVKV